MLASLDWHEFGEATILMAASSLILIAFSAGLPGFLTGVAVIVAVCRAEKKDLVEIVRAAVKLRTTSSAIPPGAGRPQRVPKNARKSNGTENPP
jgi:hypothetical protein